RGQPILFMPGEVPIATFQYFPAGEQVSWIIGNESAVATASSPACSAGLNDALTQLYAENTAAGELINRTIDLLSDPRMAELSSKLRDLAGASITPFESELLNAYDLVIANVHLGNVPLAVDLS